MHKIYTVLKARAYCYQLTLRRGTKYMYLVKIQSTQFTMRRSSNNLQTSYLEQTTKGNWLVLVRYPVDRSTGGNSCDGLTVTRTANRNLTLSELYGPPLQLPEVASKSCIIHGETPICKKNRIPRLEMKLVRVLTSWVE